MSELNVLQAELETARKIFWLLRQDAIFLSSYNEDAKTWDDGAYPVICCNDLFVPAADAESLQAEDLDFYIEVIKRYPKYGDSAWCAVKRNANLWRRRDAPWEKEYDEAVEGVRKMFEEAEVLK